MALADTQRSFASELRSLVVVDDDDNDILLIERAFRKAGLAVPVKILRNGEQVIDYLQALDWFRSENATLLPSLVLLDIKMPRKNGFEVLAWIRQQPHLSRLPVVMLTSSRENSDVNRAHSLGANAFLVKPTNFIRLVEMANRLKAFLEFGQQEFVLDFSLRPPEQLSTVGMVRF